LRHEEKGPRGTAADTEQNLASGKEKREHTRRGALASEQSLEHSLGHFRGTTRKNRIPTAWRPLLGEKTLSCKAGGAKRVGGAL